MSLNPKYYYSNSPFIPAFDSIYILEESIKHFNELPPVVDLCFALKDIMRQHIQNNIVPNETNIRISFGSTFDDILNLRFGYEHVYDSLLLAAIYDASDSKEEAIKFILGDPIEMTASYIELLKDRMDIIRALYEADATGMSVIMYLNENPLVINDYFDTGHVIANVAFYNASMSLLQAVNDLGIV